MRRGNWGQPFRLFRATAYLFALAIAAGLATTGFAQPADEDEPALPPHGLAARYWLTDPAQPVFTRVEPIAAFWLAAGETPDPRLPAKDWHASWVGQLEVLEPGEYRFDCELAGSASLEIDGKVVWQQGDAAVKGSASSARGEPIKLEFGLHPFELKYSVGGGPAKLRLYWQTATIAREPIPARAVRLNENAPTNGSLPNDPFLFAHRQMREHACTACHRVADDSPLAQYFPPQPAPRLSQAGTRLKAAWISSWLDNPQAFRPEALMPRLFSADRVGEVERFAVASYLASLGSLATEPTPKPKQVEGLTADGNRLFHQVGCMVCHQSADGAAARASLVGLQHKTTHAALAQFLRDPAAIDPSGRMPSMQLSDEDSLRLATYLIADPDRAGTEPSLPPAPSDDELLAIALPADAPAAARAEFAARPAVDKIATAARSVLAAKRCTACHELRVPDVADIVPAPVPSDWKQVIAYPTGGCLVAAADQLGKVPLFGDSASRKAIADSLGDWQAAPPTPSPAYQARLALDEMNCTACHQRQTAGGLAPAFLEQLLAGQTAENAEMVAPPPLTNVTEKLVPGYLHGVLVSGARSRPWMALRMPSFIPANVEPLAKSLAALDGVCLDEPGVNLLLFSTAKGAAVEKGDEAPPDLTQAGRRLAGSRGFGCMRCHDMLGVPSSGTRGPDLSRVTQRIRPEWFARWMHDPQRIVAGTRMPTVFLQGASPYTDVLEGVPAAQIAALWQYFERSTLMPAPEGLEAASPQEMKVVDVPVVVRGFLPGLTPRSLAIGFPQGVHLTFDAQTCRLASGFAGRFLDLSPDWTGRGGRTLSVLGTGFWNAPAGFPWTLTSLDAPPPDLTGRDQLTELGAMPPDDAKLHPSQLTFSGYRLLAGGPELDYQWRPSAERRLLFSDRLSTMRDAEALGIRRAVAFDVPEEHSLWLRVASSPEPPWIESPTGAEGSSPDVPWHAAANEILAWRADGHVYVAHLRAAPSGTQWAVSKSGTTFDLSLRFPGAAQPKREKADVVIWTLLGDVPTERARLIAHERTEKD